MMLAHDLALALDPGLLMRRHLGPSSLIPGSKRLLRSPADRTLVRMHQASREKHDGSCSSGCMRPCTRIVLSSCCRHRRHSAKVRELFRKVLLVYGAVKNKPPAVIRNSLRLELPNGSRIVSLPGKEETIRGFSGATLIIIDEAARVPDDLYYAVRPMMAVSAGRADLPVHTVRQAGFLLRRVDEWWIRLGSRQGDCLGLPASISSILGR